MGRVSNGTRRLRVVALLVAAAVATPFAGGCRSGAKRAEPVSASPPSPTASAERPAAAVGAPAPAERERPPGTAVRGPGPGADGPPAAGQPPAVFEGPPATAGQQAEPSSEPERGARPEESGSTAGAPVTGVAVDGAKQAPGPPSAEGPAPPHPAGTEAPVPRDAASGPGGRAAAVARLPESLSFDRSGPYWARGREELVYRVEFLGITMGYARFVFNGKVLLEGREVYHLSVRAWTSNVLAIIYPVNDTIDYYMDTRTLEPLRQEYTSGNRKKDDVTTYDQATGRIVYRYKESGAIRRQVDAVPNIYDPVTLAYFLRSREPGSDEKGRNVYAGRKVWEISAVPLGFEKIATERGEFDTIVIRPVIKREGKIEDKGDLRMWMTRDERKIPVRIYAKFKKIRTWTLVGELIPERKGG